MLPGVSVVLCCPMCIHGIYFPGFMLLTTLLDIVLPSVVLPWYCTVRCVSLVFCCQVFFIGNVMLSVFMVLCCRVCFLIFCRGCVSQVLCCLVYCDVTMLPGVLQWYYVDMFAFLGIVFSGVFPWYYDARCASHVSCSASLLLNN